MHHDAAIRPARLAAQERMQLLQQEIMDLILQENLAVGDPMPTETDLCSTLGVGRNTLREALKVLQALGVVEIRHGFGTFVAATSFDALASSLEFRGRLSLRHGAHEAMELVDIRQALETGLIGQAIERMDEGTLAALRLCVASMNTRAAAGETLLEDDQQFHRLLYSPLRNELLSSLLAVFWKAYRQIHLDAGMEQASLIESAQQHSAVLRAVETADTRLAADLLGRHFDGIRERLQSLTKE